MPAPAGVAAGVARRAARAVRRPGVVAAGEQLCEQQEQHHMAGQLGMRAAARLQAQGGEEKRALTVRHWRKQCGSAVGCLVYRCAPMRAGIFVAFWPWFTRDERAQLAVLVAAVVPRGLSEITSAARDAVRPCVPCGPARSAIVRAPASASAGSNGG